MYRHCESVIECNHKFLLNISFTNTNDKQQIYTTYFNKVGERRPNGFQPTVACRWDLRSCCGRNTRNLAYFSRRSRSICFR